MELNLFKEQAQAHGRFQKEDVVSIKECMEIPNLRQRGKYAKIVASTTNSKGLVAVLARKRFLSRVGAQVRSKSTTYR